MPPVWGPQLLHTILQIRSALDIDLCHIEEEDRQLIQNLHENKMVQNNEEGISLAICG